MNGSIMNHWNFVLSEIKTNGSFLIPMRIFLGSVWMRAGLEKVLSDKWFSGEELTIYLSQQIASGIIQVPGYMHLIETLFMPQAQLLSWIVVVGQLMTGLGILLGVLTNAALIGGLFMNINFVLAGSINPSAFYIVMQTVLFLANTGAILGFDKAICKRIPYEICVAQRHDIRPEIPIERWSYFALIIISLCIALASAFFINFQDFSIAHAHHDQGAVLSMLSLLGGLGALFKYLSIR